MFIEIDTPQNPLRLENTLRPYKRGEQQFTPEAAQQILESTNHKKNIYDTLQIIASLPKEQQADYKDIILSTFDHREQPTDTILLGKKLAASHNFEDELNAILTHDPMQDTINSVIYASASNQIVSVIHASSNKPKLFRYPEDITLICTNDYTDLTNTNLSKVKSLKFKENAEVNLSGCQNLPEITDLSMCRKVRFNNTDFSTIKTLKFKEGAEVILLNCENLPETLDLSMCDKVDLSYTDFSTVKTLKFKENAEVNLYDSKNHPADLDVSMCDKVGLNCTDLSKIKSLKFKEGAEVDLSYCENLPANLDVSMCCKVYLNSTNLSGIKSLKFKENAEIHLSGCQNLPADLDVSMCNRVRLFQTDLSPVKSLKFKNKQQLKESSLKVPENWQGNITYTDEQSPQPRQHSIFSRESLRGL